MFLKYYLKDVVELRYDGTPYDGATFDSRGNCAGKLFFAVKGTKSDGNEYAQQALDKGAVLAIMDNKELYEKVTGNKALVENTLDCVYSMGRKRLLDSKAVKIAVTGSYGKTGTKEMLLNALRLKYCVYGTEGNHNNELGVLLTACGMPFNTEVAVFELGSNASGEISVLSKLVKPAIALVTGAGTAHVGKFGGQKAIVKEKLSITDGLQPEGTLVVNDLLCEYVNKYSADSIVFYGANEQSPYRLTEYTVVGRTLHFVVQSKEDTFTCLLNYPYPHIAENFLAVLAVGDLLNVKGVSTVTSLASFVIPDGRGNIIDIGSLVVVDESYNASKEAVLRAIEALSLFDYINKYAVIGEIGEVSGYEKEIYDTIVEEAGKRKGVHFIFSGEAYKEYKNSDNIAVCLTEEDTFKELEKIKEGVVLVKASRSFGFEKYVKILAVKGVKHAV